MRRSMIAYRWLFLSFSWALVMSCKTTQADRSELRASATEVNLPEVGSIADVPKAKAKGLQLKTYASDGIEKFLPPADGSNGLPESLQGIWWLDGNPQPGSVLLSLQTVVHDESKNEFTWKFTEPGHYTFAADADGIKDFNAGLSAGSGYRLTFSPNGREIRIKATLTVFGQNITLPQGISDFTATLVEEGHWVRHSKVFGITAADYDMRRIVDAKGQRIEPAYSNYLKFAGPRSYLVETIKP